MKKLLSIILILTMVIAVSSCGNKSAKDEKVNSNDVIVNDTTEDSTESIDIIEGDKEETENSQETKPELKPETMPEAKPEAKPEANPETKPEAKPEQKPVEATTIGGKLLNEFKSIASSHTSALSLAEAISQNPSIEFSAMTTEVSEGYLTGFDDVEIKGFKEGAMFSPMIGTMPFVGYVFVLDSADKTGAFIENLKKNANLRWNICTEAEEMVAGSVGNKVFFVMCPKQFE